MWVAPRIRTRTFTSQRTPHHDHHHTAGSLTTCTQHTYSTGPRSHRPQTQRIPAHAAFVATLTPQASPSMPGFPLPSPTTTSYAQATRSVPFANLPSPRAAHFWPPKQARTSHSGCRTTRTLSCAASGIRCTKAKRPKSWHCCASRLNLSPFRPAAKSTSSFARAPAGGKWRSRAYCLTCARWMSACRLSASSMRSTARRRSPAATTARGAPCNMCRRMA